MQIIPMSTKIIVKRDEADEVSLGGIIMPEVAKEKPVKGTVVAVGKWNEHEVKVGDYILFLTYRGHEFTHDGVRLLALDPDDLVAILKSEDNMIWNDRLCKIEDGVWMMSAVGDHDNWDFAAPGPNATVAGTLLGAFAKMIPIDDERLLFVAQDGKLQLLIGNPCDGGALWMLLEYRQQSSGGQNKPGSPCVAEA